MSRAIVAGQAGHAGEHPADVDEQQIGDHLLLAEAGERFLLVAGEDGLPQQDGGDDGEKTQDGAEQEVAAIGHALDERHAEDVDVLAQRVPRTNRRSRPSRLHRDFSHVPDTHSGLPLAA